MKTIDAKLKADAGKARSVIAAIFDGQPPSAMRSYLKFLAASIELLSSNNGDDRWGITLFEDGIRLNVGWVQVLLLHRDGVVVSVEEKLAKGSKFEKWSFRNAPGCKVVIVPLSELSHTLPSLTEAHHSAISIAAERKTTKYIREAHSVGVTHYLSEFLQQTVPYPSYHISEPAGRMTWTWLYAISAGKGRTFDIDGKSTDVTVNSYRQLLEDGRLDKDSWHVRNHGKDAEAGDDVFIYTGDQNLGIIGCAKIKGKKPCNQGWSLNLEFDRDKSLMLLEHPIPASVVRTWGVNLRGNLVDLSRSASELYTWIAPAPDEIIDSAGLPEGALHKVTANAYERNPDARRLCIEHYGAICSVCGFKFGAVYGEAFEEFIHVHHLRPLSEIGRQYVVDPIKDLRPVCPNCHAVLHRRADPPYSIEEVRAFLRPKVATRAR